MCSLLFPREPSDDDNTRSGGESSTLLLVEAVLLLLPPLAGQGLVPFPLSFLLRASRARETSPSVKPALVAWWKAWKVCLRAAEAVPFSLPSTQLVWSGVEGADWGVSQECDASPSRVNRCLASTVSRPLGGGVL